jgi:hypothetical protein
MLSLIGIRQGSRTVGGSDRNRDSRGGQAPFGLSFDDSEAVGTAGSPRRILVDRKHRLPLPVVLAILTWNRAHVPCLQSTKYVSASATSLTLALFPLLGLEVRSPEVVVKRRSGNLRWSKPASFSNPPIRYLLLFRGKRRI